MKANKNNISFETSKLLKGCGVESLLYWAMNDDNRFELVSVKNGYVEFKNGTSINYEWIDENEKFIPAYTWQEIEENADKFFGMEENSYHLIQLLLLRLENKYDEVDEYFRKHCILIK